MGWKEKWEDFKETLLHPQKAQEPSAEEEMKAQHGRREEALHRTDQSTGSETLDD